MYTELKESVLLVCCNLLFFVPKFVKVMFICFNVDLAKWLYMNKSQQRNICVALCNSLNYSTFLFRI